MRQELKDKLVENYSFMKNVSLGIGDGWFSILDNLCKEIDPLVSENFKVTQIKEKFGGLRFYYDLEDYHHFDILYSSHISFDNIRNKINKLIAKAEADSFETCEICGDPASLDKSSFWVKSLCEFHKLERENGRQS